MNKGKKPKSPKKITPIPVLSGRNPKQYMEVHHHPNLHHAPKPWKEYLLEGLMIFLAVMLGFFAESLRERMTEKTSARDFLETYRDELQQQQADFNAYDALFHKKIEICDGLVAILNEGRENTDLKTVERLLLPCKKIIYIPINTSAYDQMISSGTLRYIKNIPLRDSMAYYKSLMDALKNYNTQTNLMLFSGELEVQKLEDVHDMIKNSAGNYAGIITHVPYMKPYPVMTERERRYLLGYYEDYIVIAASSINKLYTLNQHNHALLSLVNRELDK